MINSEEIEDIVDETEEERQITTIDAVNFALSGDAVGFKDTVDELLSDRLADLINIKKTEIAQSFIKDNEDEEI